MIFNIKLSKTGKSLNFKFNNKWGSISKDIISKDELERMSLNELLSFPHVIKNGWTFFKSKKTSVFKSSLSKDTTSYKQIVLISLLNTNLITKETFNTLFANNIYFIENTPSLESKYKKMLSSIIMQNFYFIFGTSQKKPDFNELQNIYSAQEFRSIIHDFALEQEFQNWSQNKNQITQNEWNAKNTQINHFEIEIQKLLDGGGKKLGEKIIVLPSAEVFSVNTEKKKIQKCWVPTIRNANNKKQLVFSAYGNIYQLKDVVAKLFLTNPHKLKKVVQKDKNYWNCHISNLKWESKKKKKKAKTPQSGFYIKGF